MTEFMEIDGSFGEGGGQILRSSLTLSLVTGRPLRIVNIRSKRKNPGLLRQHLAAVGAARQVGRAETSGEELGSTRLEFIPTGLFGGEYSFQIGSAGSATLVLQTILPALALAPTPSMVRGAGGTDNPLAPPFDHLAQTFLPLLNRMGPNVSLELDRHGFFPAGGGELTARITPCENLTRLELEHRGKIERAEAKILSAHLPESVAEREKRELIERTGWPSERVSLERVDSVGPGNVVLISARSASITETFSAFGKLGVPAERVASSAFKQYERYLHFDAPVGEYTADQLILPMSLAAWQGNGGSALRTLPLTEHSRTHLALVERFLGIRAQITTEPTGIVRLLW